MFETFATEQRVQHPQDNDVQKAITLATVARQMRWSSQPKINTFII